MSQYLNQEGHKEIKRHHTRWAYETLGLQSVAPKPHTSQPHPEHKVYPYLLNNVEITAINQVWGTDLTYIRLKHGFVYLMAIIDWFSRFVLDWSLNIALEAECCVETLKRVLDNVFVERLWRSVKYECVYLFDWETVADARKRFHDYFEFYNYRRPHQALKGNTPTFVHLQMI